jgi:hypothetical protein
VEIFSKGFVRPTTVVVFGHSLLRGRKKALQLVMFCSLGYRIVLKTPMKDVSLVTGCNEEFAMKTRQRNGMFREGSHEEPNRA